MVLPDTYDEEGKGHFECPICGTLSPDIDSKWDWPKWYFIAYGHGVAGNLGDSPDIAWHFCSLDHLLQWLKTGHDASEEFSHAAP